MANSNYNPDVLNCIANLSNDEVFTPPELANKVLDLLPQDLFSNPNSTFLDPFSKSGVFLREIVKRLDRGLESRIPDRQERIDHILHTQVYGIAITELTSYLSRRSLYCSNTPTENIVFLISTPRAAISFMTRGSIHGKTVNANTVEQVKKCSNAMMLRDSMPINLYTRLLPNLFSI